MKAYFKIITLAFEMPNDHSNIMHRVKTYNLCPYTSSSTIVNLVRDELSNKVWHHPKGFVIHNESNQIPPTKEHIFTLPTCSSTVPVSRPCCRVHKDWYHQLEKVPLLSLTTYSKMTTHPLSIVCIIRPYIRVYLHI